MPPAPPFSFPPRKVSGIFYTLNYAYKRSLQHGLHGVYALHAR